jgi:uncharacterized protein (DUF1778 family)
MRQVKARKWSPATVSGSRSYSFARRRKRVAQANETLADRQRFGVDAEQWAAFMEALDAPARDLPRTTRLLHEPSVFDAGEAG